MSMKQIRAGLIGHKFMGKAHSHALHDVALFFDLASQRVRRTLCGLGDDLAETAARYGWQRHTNSWREVVEDPEIDSVSIATPGNTHCEIAVAAEQAGKHVLCEKPLALNGPEAARMHDAAESAGVRHVVNFNYRRVPAVRLAKKLIQEGKLGEIYYFRGTWQSSARSKIVNARVCICGSWPVQGPNVNRSHSVMSSRPHAVFPYRLTRTFGNNHELL